MWFQKLILHVVPVDVPGMENLGVSWPMLAFALAVSTVSGMIFGIMPAVQATRVNVADNIKSGTRTTDARGQGFQSSLVVAQVAVSVILLDRVWAAAQKLRHAPRREARIRHAELAIPRRSGLLRTNTPTRPMRIEFFSTLAEELRAIPGVTDVAVINQLPIRNPGNNPAVYAADKPPPDHSDRVGA